MLPGTFAELPFDAKDHLISYHTEGQGEDRVTYMEAQTEELL